MKGKNINYLFVEMREGFLPLYKDAISQLLHFWLHYGIVSKRQQENIVFFQVHPGLHFVKFLSSVYKNTFIFLEVCFM